MSNQQGRSLNPSTRTEEVVEAAWRDGIFSAICTAIPSGTTVWYLLKTSEKFRRSTNFSSRTALIIMPPLFAFGFSSERKVEHKKQEMAVEYEHNTKFTSWAEKEHNKQKQQQQDEQKKLRLPFQNNKPSSSSKFDLHGEEMKLTEMYRNSIANSGVCVVPGDKLGPHHLIANFWQENPFKVLAAAGVPTVLYIFKGRNDKAHLQLQSKIMHTRVFGQFAVISMLLGIMGFKAFMDSNGKFITEAEAEMRVQDMKLARDELLLKLENNKAEDEHMKELARALYKAQEEETSTQQIKQGSSSRSSNAMSAE